MPRDIDYAAEAVQRAIDEKFASNNAITDLQVKALERTIMVRHGNRVLEDTRDNLLAAVRRSVDLWDLLPES